jgi:FKBP-type peptidyl-prolyl cis-trans isomerase FklB
MRYLFVTLLSIGFLFNICYADEKLDLKDQKNKESYSLGYQFGQSLKAQGLEVNLDVYISGIKDCLGGKQPAMTQEEIRATISELQNRLMAVREKELKEMAEKNLGPSQAFLEENRKKEGVKVLPSGLQYKVLTEGSGKIPKATDTVTVHYIGALINGAEFDNSYKRGQPITVPVNGVLPGWNEALQLMKEGSKWQIFIPPTLGYGDRGMGPVPPNSIMIYEVELLSVK